MPRLTDLSMTTMDVLMALADGNPGAINVMMLMMEQGEKIDPDSAFGVFGGIVALDTHGIYGSRIWCLYKDVCGQSIEETLAALRAVQLGIARASDLSAAIDGKGDKFDAGKALLSVRERLPSFASSYQPSK